MPFKDSYSNLRFNQQPNYNLTTLPFKGIGPLSQFQTLPNLNGTGPLINVPNTGVPYTPFELNSNFNYSGFQDYGKGNINNNNNTPIDLNPYIQGLGIINNLGGLFLANEQRKNAKEYLKGYKDQLYNNAVITERQAAEQDATRIAGSGGTYTPLPKLNLRKGV